MDTTKISIVFSVVELQTDAARRDLNLGNLTRFKESITSIELLLKRVRSYVNEAEALVKKES